MGDAANDEEGGRTGQNTSTKKRQRSQLAFPYADLQRSRDLSDKLAELGGAGAVELTQLAAAMNQTADGGTFRGRISAARMFGLIEFSGETAQLTDLGKDILDPMRAAAAKVTAFLRVPLYEKLYSEFQGYPLPPAAAIERKLVMLGLPQKQVDRARQAFAGSADFAGFINSNGRFVKPVVSARADPADDTRENPFKVDPDKDRGDGKGRTGGGGGGWDEPPSGKNHPLIQGLLVTLPEPGQEWSDSDRKAWLEMAESIFKMIYPLPEPAEQQHPLSAVAKLLGEEPSTELHDL